jgi:1-acyl-sn-glycerol-3-phosphate acyltransferase
MIGVVRGLFAWVGGLLFTAACAVVFFALLPFFGAAPRLSFAIVRFWSRILVSGFLASTVEVSGKECIRRGAPFIIVSNHRSYLDILVAHAALDIPFLWLAKSELFRIPVFGMAMRILGHIPVEREKVFASSRALVKAGEALRAGTSIWVFPEGTRTPIATLGRFKRGAFLLALRTGAPLLPVAVVGSDRIFDGPFRVTPRKVTVTLTEPVPVPREPNGNLTAVIDDVRGRIQRVYDRAASA